MYQLIYFYLANNRCIKPIDNHCSAAKIRKTEILKIIIHSSNIHYTGRRASISRTYTNQNTLYIYDPIRFFGFIPKTKLD